jgi:predicted DsbA family dithiol-disulfide isomerase
MIEVYADIWCPFAHVGLRAVVRYRNHVGRNDVAIRVRAWPLELVNGAPLDPQSTSQHVYDLRTQVAAGLFKHFDPDHFPTTSVPALSLAAAAYRQGDRTGEAVSFALRDALFEEGRDISRRDVLVSLANSHGVDPDFSDDGAVLSDWREGETRGVKGSPHFFCGTIDAFCPSLDISKDEDGHLQLRPNMEALDVFLTECFK